jgi:hypothetical protein
MNDKVLSMSLTPKMINPEYFENNTLKIVIADGAYDSKENFRYLYDNNIEAAIKVRKNSSY